MCGICGKLNFNDEGIDAELLKRMTGALIHRGPDDEGIFISPNIGLGHRRLSIIDLSPAGHQPMSNEDDSVWLVFNGEIYDYREHRKKLLSKGHLLKSQTDCETIIHLYEDGGTDSLALLNGMFAFALWDSKTRELLLVRDRLGIKPLHYYWDGKRLIFASEIKAILYDPEVKREIDWEALDLYLTLNYIPAPMTIFKNIRKLEPGKYLLANEEGITLQSYWDIPKNPSGLSSLSNDIPIEENKRHLYHLIEDSVKRRLISDVPLGAFLSGGIDSSIIVALMAKNSSRPVKTFSIGYKDLPSFDETIYAQDVAHFYSTDHHEFKLGYRDLLEAFPAILENFDEPFADSSAVPTFIVSRETRNKVTVALSGDGGDELFAGYRMYQGEYWSHFYNKIPYFLRKEIIAPLMYKLPDARDKPGLEILRRMKKFIKGMGDSFADRFYGWREIFPYTTRLELLKEPVLENIYLNRVRKMVEKEKHRFPEDHINLMLFLDLKGLLPGDMLSKVDRMSMANSLEVRVPMLDHSVVEYVFQLEGNKKLQGRTGKVILTETFKKLLPPSLHKRPKRGFEIPIGAWLRKELKFLIDEYLEKDLIAKQELFRFETIHKLIDNHLNRRQDTSWHLWNLIVFQHWYRTYF